MCIPKMGQVVRIGDALGQEYACGSHNRTSRPMILDVEEHKVQ